ncbi:hypothetical protein PHYSODRAFT_293131 [Phytophthora sojae]|uniref:Uncharacterized protein n=1 Tax=Phytophthora sojae (strain P6497) TaxID=1094619 RepID=G4YGS0_PHYSP|nr:hypothetical protein PHYSODRAFT_293131 [Phytophthora sojae]EGZ27029.1 hypothetical protein PHYSODRAFT_293131 [Phytophthora sojae]|eukprot:XP_009514304.1 hypothetical protein PHYSODRAFT_293131 [Phytophthora sojae]
MLKLRRIPALTPAIPQFAFFQRNEVSPAATPHEIPRPSLGLASDPSYDVEPVPSAGRPTRARDSALPWIPVLLKQGETTQQYENAFKDWLRRRDAELDSLHSRPEVERRFRLDFADSRAWELRRKSVSTATRSHRARSREELLEMEEMSPDAFLRSVERFGPNGPLRAGKKLKPIAVVLRPNEPRRYFEQNFERWLESKEVTLAELQDDPEEERCYRQAFAYTRAREHVARVQCGYFSPTSNKQLRPRFRSRSRGRSTSRSRDKRNFRESGSRTRGTSRESRRRKSRDSDRCDSNWSRKHSSRSSEKRVRDLGGGTPPAQDAVSLLSPTASSLNPASEAGVEFSAGKATGGLSTSDNASSTDQSPDLPTSFVDEGQTSVETNKASETLATVRQLAPVEALNRPANPEINIFSAAMNQQQLRQEILITTQILARAKRVTVDSTKQRLVEEYTRVVECILAYAKEMAAYDEAEATRCRQEMEMKMSVEIERQRRDSALAAVLVHEWRDHKEQLDQMLARSDCPNSLVVSHAELAAVYNRMMHNDLTVARLQGKLRGLLVAGNLHQNERLRGLKALSSDLNAALLEKPLLDAAHDKLCASMLQSSATLVLKLQKLQLSASIS